jgi:predicted permease
MASTTPMNGRQGFGEFVSREEKPETRNDLNAAFDAVDGDFFKAMGIPLLRGRFFSETDNQESAPKVMIINEALARRLFGDEDALGRLLNWKNATWEIVGVVGNVRQYQLDVEPRPGLYLPPIHFPWYTTFVVRTEVPPMTLAADMRRAVRAVDPEQPLANLETMKAAVERSLQGRKTMLTLLLIFAAVALALSCIGIYGVMAYAVSQRTREMGIRIALGAGVKRILLLVLRDGLKRVLIGAAIGAAASLGAGRVISSQLYATSGADPLVLGFVALAVLAVAAAACWLPARRATRVSPMTALRCE